MDQAVPAREWDLSAPAILVLLWGPETNDTWAIKLALIELVVRRHLSLYTVDVPRLFRDPKSVIVFGQGERFSERRSSALQAIMDCMPAPHHYANGNLGVPVQELVQEVFKRQLVSERVRGRIRWRPSGPGYVITHILPELAARGYVDQEKFKYRLWMTSTWSELTDEGKNALRDLGEEISNARERFGDWVERDSARALQFAERCGTVLLLVPGLAFPCRRLQQQIRDHPPRESASRVGRTTGNQWSSHSPPIGLDLLAGTFGKGARYDLDTVFHVISAEVDRAWTGFRHGPLLVLTSGE